MYKLATNYMKYKYWGGGATSSEQTNEAVGIPMMASGIVDSMYQPDQYGAKPLGASVASGALKGAAMGSAIMPGIGTGVGAVAGAAYGYFAGKSQRAQAGRMRSEQTQAYNQQNANRSAAAISVDPSLVYGHQFASDYAFGGDTGGDQPPAGLWRTNRRGWVDSTLSANRGLDWVKRLYDKNAPTIQIPGQPYRSTHFMGDDAKGYVFPTVVRRDSTQPLRYIGDEAEDYARDTRTGIQFLTPEQGSWFAANGYKTGTGVNNDIQNGHVQNNPNYRVHAMGGQMETAGGVTLTPSQRASSSNRGVRSRPLAENYLSRFTKADGGSLSPMSADTVAINGPSHEQGGVDLPGANAEVEGGETMKGDFVFSDRLGFADEHKRLATAIGAIQKKGVMTPEKVNAIKRMQDREAKLALSQEYLKHILSGGQLPDPTQQPSPQQQQPS